MQFQSSAGTPTVHYPEASSVFYIADMFQSSLGALTGIDKLEQGGANQRQT
jgi:hypothetical protein